MTHLLNAHRNYSTESKEQVGILGLKLLILTQDNDTKPKIQENTTNLPASSDPDKIPKPALVLGVTSLIPMFTGTLLLDATIHLVKFNERCTGRGFGTRRSHFGLQRRFLSDDLCGKSSFFYGSGSFGSRDGRLSTGTSCDGRRWKRTTTATTNEASIEGQKGLVAVFIEYRALPCFMGCACSSFTILWDDGDHDWLHGGFHRGCHRTQIRPSASVVHEATSPGHHRRYHSIRYLVDGSFVVVVQHRFFFTFCPVNSSSQILVPLVVGDAIDHHTTTPASKCGKTSSKKYLTK